MLQYAKYYSGDPIRNWAGWYLGYPFKDALFESVNRARGLVDETGHVDDLAIPVSPQDPTETPVTSPPPPGVLEGTYPVTPRSGG